MKKLWSSIASAALLVACTLPAYAEKTMEADIAVVGGGLSGLAAATQASQLGAKVIVLEKQAKVGGTGLFCEGVFAAESKVQKRIGINVTKDFAFKLIMDYGHWKNNGALAKHFVDRSAETIDWMDSLGIKIEYVGVGGHGGPLTWHVIAPGPDYLSGKNKKDYHCERVINVFNKYVTDHGGQVLLQTPGTDLIREGNKVVGVWAKDKSGEKIRINAKAVVMATGGFSSNKEMMKKYYPEYPDITPVGNIGKDGDGIRMGAAAGADLEGMNTVEGYRPGLPGFHPADQMIALAVQPYFWVTPRGERYTDESNIVFWPYSNNALVRVGGVAYSIYDDATRKMAVEQGIEMPLGEWVLAGTKLVKWEDSFNKELARKRGFVFKADTIEELARQLKMKPEVLQASVDQMNKAAESRTDELFGKPAKFLRKVATGPFYATKLTPRHLGTLGGMKVTRDNQVVDTKGEPISGLYAVGTDSGGMYGDSYDLLLGGGTAGYAINSGRFAAEHAVKYIKQ